ncbi:MAG: helix-turn-helix domain-containing protein [Candidatus Sphingomonas phytovorans]|nr:helix-turn-helix domain-containing protein [Sphingomonas sp.]WEK02272.1 MAG: helix-turn-helix domain-containing protein [Sphingomonas sp.]
MKISAGHAEPLFPTDEGILRPDSPSPSLRMERFSPPSSLQPYLDHLWIAEWDIPAETSLPLDIVAMPCVNLVLVGENAFVAGVKTERQRHVLSGSGRIAGLRFKPGGFRPFFLQPVARIRNMEIPAASVHPSLSPAWARSCLSRDDFGVTAGQVFETVAALPVHRVPRTEAVERILKICWSQPELPVPAIARSGGLNIRTLEALFHDSVGVSLVWIRRQIRALSAMRMGGHEGGWAGIAQQLGYSDQAHMTNQFKQAIGVPPGIFLRKTGR